MSFSGYYSPRLFLTSLLPLLNEIPRFKEKNKFQQYQVQQFVFLRMEVPDRVWANYLKSECTPLQTALLFSLFDISVSHSALSPPELINSGSPNILPAYQGSLCKRSPTGGFQGQMKCNPSVSSHLKYTQCFFFFFPKQWNSSILRRWWCHCWILCFHSDMICSALWILTDHCRQVCWQCCAPVLGFNLAGSSAPCSTHPSTVGITPHAVLTSLASSSSSFVQHDPTCYGTPTWARVSCPGSVPSPAPCAPSAPSWQCEELKCPWLCVSTPQQQLKQWC